MLVRPPTRRRQRGSSVLEYALLVFMIAGVLAATIGMYHSLASTMPFGFPESGLITSGLPG